MSYKDTKVYENENDAESNTLTAKRRDQCGIYPMSGGGSHQSERLPQVLVTGIGKPNKLRTYTNTIIANQNKIGRFERTYVIKDD